MSREEDEVIFRTDRGLSFLPLKVCVRTRLVPV